MSKGLAKKINKLENRVLPDVEKGSTRLACLTVDVRNGPQYYVVLDIPQIEAQLFHKSYDVRQMYESLDNPQISLEHQKILHTAGRRLFARSLDLFENVWGTFFDLCGEDNRLLGAFFRMRLWWFLNEMFRHAELLRKEDELGKKYPKSWKKFEQAFEAWDKARENRTPLWTRESFSRFIEPAFRKFKETEQP